MEPGSICGRTGYVLDAGQVVGHHVHDGVGDLPECLRIHVDEPGELGRVEPVQWTAG